MGVYMYVQIYVCEEEVFCLHLSSEPGVTCVAVKGIWLNTKVAQGANKANKQTNNSRFDGVGHIPVFLQNGVRLFTTMAARLSTLSSL